MCTKIRRRSVTIHEILQEQNKIGLLKFTYLEKKNQENVEDEKIPRKKMEILEEKLSDKNDPKKNLRWWDEGTGVGPTPNPPDLSPGQARHRHAAAAPRSSLSYISELWDTICELRTTTLVPTLDNE